MASWTSIARRALRKVSGRDAAGADIALVAASDLFDRAWYLATYPDIAAAGTDPAAHYVRSGGREGRDPGPNFSSEGYLARYPDVASAGANPLVHYLRSGRAEGREAPTSKGGGSSAADIALVAASDLFDRAWYLATYPDVAASGADPAQHYVEHGFTEGRNPGPNFSTSWYLAEHRDVAEGGANPLVHFLRNGQAEARATAAAGASHKAEGSTVGDVTLVAASEYFSRNWYLAQYPDVGDTDADPAAHYTNQGYKEGRDPGPRFSTNWYLATYRDVAQLKINPLVHFLRAGQAEGRAPGPDVASLGKAITPSFAATASDLTVLVASGWFDADWYLAQYPEVAAAGLDPATHYLERGPAEGKDPGPRFSTRWYLSEHPDVAASGGNPLVHYLRNGQAEGREIAPSPRAIGITPGAAEAPLSFAHQRAKAPAAITWQRDLESRADVVRTGGLAIGALPESRDTDLGKVVATLAPVAGAPGDDGEGPCVLRALAEPPATVNDIWFTTAFDLRVRLQRRHGFGVVRLFQVRPGTYALALVGEALTGETGTSFVTAQLVDPFSPLLVTVSDPDGTLRSAEIVPFPSLCRGGPHYGETCAYDAAAGYLASLRSLSDKLAPKLLARRKDGKRAVTRLIVDLTQANGSEAIFQPAIRGWLREFMGVAFSTANPPEDPKTAAYLRDALGAAETGPETPASGSLTLPADAIPAIGTLLAERSDGDARRPASYVVTDDARRVPRWLVAMPGDPALLVIQPEGASGFPILGAGAGTSVGSPAAIRFRSLAPAAEASLLLPAPADWSVERLARPPGKPSQHDRSVSAIIPANGLDADGFAVLLESLSLQTCAADIDVTLVGGPAQDRESMRAALSKYFPGRHFIVGDQPGPNQSQGINRAAARSDSRFVVIADGRTMLHDPRTLDVLRTLSDGPRIGCAGSMTVAEIRTPKTRSLEFLSGGVFCRLNTSADGITEAEFSEPDTHAIFPFATYPVAAIGLGVLMARSDSWRQLGGFDAAAWPGPGASVDYGLRAMRAGFTNLCTSAVSTIAPSQKPAANAGLPRIRRRLTSPEAAAVRRQSCVLTDLHG